MANKLYYNTVNDTLLTILRKLMDAPEFTSFRLVGGTALSLQLGHRMSVDIDLFSDAEYGTLDFEAIDNYLHTNFNYVDCPSGHKDVAMGLSYYVGDSETYCIKLDLFYTDKFIRPCKEIDGIRLATVEEIAAMKVDVVARGGRKKDFWDIHEMANNIPLKQMLSLHEERYPYAHKEAEIIAQFADFSIADNDFDPQCFRGKFWEVVKLDLLDLATELS